MRRALTLYLGVATVLVGCGNMQAEQKSDSPASKEKQTEASVPEAGGGAKQAPALEFEFRLPSPSKPFKTGVSVKMECTAQFKCSDKTKVPTVVMFMFRRGKVSAGQFIAEPVSLGDDLYECKATLKTPPAAGKYILTVQSQQEMQSNQIPTAKLDVIVQP